MQHRSSKTLALFLLLALLLSPTGLGTWSVIVANRVTGEVGVAQATCIVGPDLQPELAVVLPGFGGACVQAQWDFDGSRRKLIWDELRLGTDPADIIELLKAAGNGGTHQFGIVDLEERSATHTPSGAGIWKGGRTGQAGDLVWAIQGNVLAGRNVVLEAERALLNTPGDLAEKLMAAMLAAASAGGDGRCSCRINDPPGCGDPPPDFDLDTDKSAHVGFMIVSRTGEARSRCRRDSGCAQGDYYLELNVSPGQGGLPDPIVEMEQQFQDWRNSWIGRPDHLLSTVTPRTSAVPGNGVATTTLLLELRDYVDFPVGQGGATIQVNHRPDSAGLASVGAVQDHGDGTYSIPLTAGLGQGLDLLGIRVDDGQGQILLYPVVELQHTDTLRADTAFLSAASGGTVRFTLHGPHAVTQRRSYLMLASASGTLPGTPLGSLTLPLNFDPLFLFSYLQRNTTEFHHSEGVLATNGFSDARFSVPPGALEPLIGSELSFAWFTTDFLDFVSNAVPLRIDP